ncbi:TetR family transcriptional regulator [Arthrobacter sp. SAFR-044]|uniref:TetR family transcriptional regulator n=1 Tax=Arthrobacter sp. SAFR-044 TaxID=3387278 RepID=UPI003F7B540C
MSLRERQQTQIRDELRSVSFELFLREGFDEVAISQIAAEAGISERTFYRYFATKEDVALDWIDDIAGAMHRQLRAVPSEVSPVEAFVRAFVGLERLPHLENSQRMHLILTTPRLLSAYTLRQHAWEASAAEVMADRLGVDGRMDARPALWSAIAFSVAFRVAVESAVHGVDTDYEQALRSRFEDAESFFATTLASATVSAAV